MGDRFKKLNTNVDDYLTGTKTVKKEKAPPKQTGKIEIKSPIGLKSPFDIIEESRNLVKKVPQVGMGDLKAAEQYGPAESVGGKDIPVEQISNPITEKYITPNVPDFLGQFIENLTSVKNAPPKTAVNTQGQKSVHQRKTETLEKVRSGEVRIPELIKAQGDDAILQYLGLEDSGPLNLLTEKALEIPFALQNLSTVIPTGVSKLINPNVDESKLLPEIDKRAGYKKYTPYEMPKYTTGSEIKDLMLKIGPDIAGIILTQGAVGPGIQKVLSNPKLANIISSGLGFVLPQQPRQLSELSAGNITPGEYGAETGTSFVTGGLFGANPFKGLLKRAVFNSFVTTLPGQYASLMRTGEFDIKEYVKSAVTQGLLDATMHIPGLLKRNTRQNIKEDLINDLTAEAENLPEKERTVENIITSFDRILEGPKWKAITKENRLLEQGKPHKWEISPKGEITEVKKSKAEPLILTKGKFWNDILREDKPFGYKDGEIKEAPPPGELTPSSTQPDSIEQSKIKPVITPEEQAGREQRSAEVKRVQKEQMQTKVIPQLKDWVNRAATPEEFRSRIQRELLNNTDRIGKALVDYGYVRNYATSEEGYKPYMEFYDTFKKLPEQKRPLQQYVDELPEPTREEIERAKVFVKLKRSMNLNMNSVTAGWKMGSGQIRKGLNDIEKGKNYTQEAKLVLDKINQAYKDGIKNNADLRNAVPENFITGEDLLKLTNEKLGKKEAEGKGENTFLTAERKANLEQNKKSGYKESTQKDIFPNFKPPEKLDEFKQTLVNIATTGEGVSAEGIKKARELANESKDLFTTEQRNEINLFVKDLQDKLLNIKTEKPEVLTIKQIKEKQKELDKIKSRAGKSIAELYPTERAEGKGEKTYYRGIPEGSQETGDLFYSASREVAEEYKFKMGKEGKNTEIKESELPKKLYEAESKEDLAKEIGLETDKVYKIDYEFDRKAKDILQKRGYEGIRYKEGTWFEGGPEEEIHIFKKKLNEVIEKKYEETTKAIKEGKGKELFNIKPETEYLQDFGEKFGMARKDYYKLLDSSKELDITKHPLSETFPEPNYIKLSETIPAETVGFVRAMRDGIESKPQKSWKMDRYVEQVKFIRETAEGILKGKYDIKRAIELLKQFPRLRNIGFQAEMYSKLGHEKSLKGIDITLHNYKTYKGITYEEPKAVWTIYRKIKKSRFGNIETLADGDTRTEAIENFINKYSELSTKNKKTDFIVYKYRDNDNVWIGKKIGRNYINLKSGFKDFTEARQYLNKNISEIEDLLDKKKFVPSERNEENRPRTGQRERGKRNITSDEFLDKFGFKGVEFGNWVSKKNERQTAVNLSYDALEDLANALNVPADVISLNSKLGIAFGSRGTGGLNAPAAHFEPNKVVINLTRRHGPGSLAHEWFHALDNYLIKGRDNFGYLSDKNLIEEVPNKILSDSFKNLIEILKKDTGIFERSEELDYTRSKPYWSLNHEVAARSFENYIIEKLNEKGITNDYLANVKNNVTFTNDMAKRLEDPNFSADKMYPYLLENEIPKVKEAFDNIFQRLETTKDIREMPDRNKFTSEEEYQKALKRSENPINRYKTLDEKYAEAKQRVADRKNNYGLQSSIIGGFNPENIPDYVIIGAKHFKDIYKSSAEKVVKFAEWSNKMIDDLGEYVKPYLRQIWKEVEKQKEDLLKATENTEGKTREDFGFTEKGEIKTEGTELTPEVIRELENKAIEYKRQGKSNQYIRDKLGYDFYYEKDPAGELKSASFMEAVTPKENLGKGDIPELERQAVELKRKHKSNASIRQILGHDFTYTRNDVTGEWTGAKHWGEVKRSETSKVKSENEWEGEKEGIPLKDRSNYAELEQQYYDLLKYRRMLSKGNAEYENVTESVKKIHEKMIEIEAGMDEKYYEYAPGKTSAEKKDLIGTALELIPKLEKIAAEKGYQGEDAKEQVKRLLTKELYTNGEFQQLSSRKKAKILKQLDKFYEERTKQEFKLINTLDEQYTEPKLRNFFKKSVLQSIKVVDKMGEGGKEIAKRLRQMEDHERQLMGEPSKIMLEAEKLTPEEFNNLQDIRNSLMFFEEPINPKSDNVARVNSMLDNYYNKMAEGFKERGFITTNPATGEKYLFNPLQRYEPRILDLKIDKLGITRDTQGKPIYDSKREQILQYLVDTNQADNKAEAEAKLQGFIAMQNTRIGRQGNVEFARVLEFPRAMYVKDPITRLIKYGTRSAKRLAHADAFGIEGNIASRLLDRLRGEYYDQQFARDLYRYETGQLTVSERKALESVNVLKGIQAVTKFSPFTTLRNAMQGFLGSTSRGNLKAGITGLLRGFTKDAKKYAYWSGALADTLENYVGREMGGESKFVSNYLKWIGFTGTDKFNRIISSAAGEVFYKDMLKRIQTDSILKRRAGREFDKMGLDTEQITKRGHFTEEELNKIRRTFAGDAQFNIRPSDLPLYWSSPVGKLITQWKSFGYKMTQLINDNIIKETKAGNIFPLLTMLGAYTITGEAVNTIIDAMRSVFNFNPRKEDIDSEGFIEKTAYMKLKKGKYGEFALRIVSDLSGLGAMSIAVDIFRSMGYGKSSQMDTSLGVTGAVFGPTISTGVGVTADIIGPIAWKVFSTEGEWDAVFKRSMRGAYRTAIANIPFMSIARTLGLTKLMESKIFGVEPSQKMKDYQELKKRGYNITKLIEIDAMEKETGKLRKKALETEDPKDAEAYRQADEELDLLKDSSEEYREYIKLRKEEQRENDRILGKKKKYKVY